MRACGAAILLGRTGRPPPEARSAAFVAHFDDWERALPEAVAYRLADANVTGEERERVRRLLT